MGAGAIILVAHKNKDVHKTCTDSVKKIGNIVFMDINNVYYTL
jgi:hypothetical protein